MNTRIPPGPESQESPNGYSTQYGYGGSASSPAGVSDETGEEFLRAVLGDETEVEGVRRRLSGGVVNGHGNDTRDGTTRMYVE